MFVHWLVCSTLFTLSCMTSLEQNWLHDTLRLQHNQEELKRRCVRARTVSCWVWCRARPGRCRWRGLRERTASRNGPGASCPARAPPRHSSPSGCSCPTGWRCWGWRGCRRSRRKPTRHRPDPSWDGGRLVGQIGGIAMLLLRGHTEGPASKGHTYSHS